MHRLVEKASNVLECALDSKKKEGERGFEPFYSELLCVGREKPSL
jgi:hypothetical protein